MEADRKSAKRFRFTRALCEFNLSEIGLSSPSASAYRPSFGKKFKGTKTESGLCSTERRRRSASLCGRRRSKAPGHRRAHSLVSYLTESYLQQVAKRTVQLPQVVETVQEAWIPQPELDYSSAGSEVGAKQISTMSTSSKYSTVLLRRRLSAPEIIMRRHVLAQQKQSSIDSETVSTDKSTSSTLRRCYDHSFWNRISSIAMNETRNSNISDDRPLELTEPPELLNEVNCLHQEKDTWSNGGSPARKTTTASISSSGTIQESLYSQTTQSRVSTSASINSSSCFSRSGAATSNSSDCQNTTHTAVTSCESDRLMNQEKTAGTPNTDPTEANPTMNDPTERDGSFYLPRTKQAAEKCRLIRCMISNVRAGSMYGRPFGEGPLVIPRYSALPRSTSMEVNPSSPSSSGSRRTSPDRGSDSGSLVDSLDERDTPRHSTNVTRSTPMSHSHDDKPVRGDLLALLPDNSVNGHERRSVAHQKPAAFFIPMLSEDSLEKDTKSVAERMPLKVRDKLDRRKQNMDRKKCDTGVGLRTEQFTDENANNPLASNYLINSERRSSRDRRNRETHSKLLPLPLRTYGSTEAGQNTINTGSLSGRRARQSNRLTVKKGQRDEDNIEYSPLQNSLRHPQWLTQIPNSTVNESYQKSNCRKPDSRISDRKIEILEITEETINGQLFHHSPKSRIPILVHNRNTPEKQEKHCIYDRINIQNTEQQDQKTDQLIANLLIDTLNKPETHAIPVRTLNSGKRDWQVKTNSHQIADKRCSVYQQRKFEIIPEEKSLSRGSSDDQLYKVNSFIDASSQTDDRPLQCSPLSKGKAALGKTRDDDTSTIPKGWITFYMLRKNPGSSTSSTDEGAIKSVAAENQKKNVPNAELQLVQLKPSLAENAEIANRDHLPVAQRDSSRDANAQREMDNKSARLASEQDSDGKQMCSSLPLSSYLPLRKNKRLSQRQRRLRVTQTAAGWSKANKLPGEWSVTVSGINTCGQPVPDVEMKLKFPSSQTNTRPELGFANKQFDAVHFQHADKPTKNILQDGYLLGGRTFQYLPELIRSGRNQTLTKCSAGEARPGTTGVTRMPPLGMAADRRRPPRHTLTSYRRFSLHHSKHLPPQLRLLSGLPDLRSSDLMHLPECLSVLGSAVPHMPAVHSVSVARNKPRPQIKRNYYPASTGIGTRTQ